MQKVSRNNMNVCNFKLALTFTLLNAKVWTLKLFLKPLLFCPLIKKRLLEVDVNKTNIVLQTPFPNYY